MAMYSDREEPRSRMDIDDIVENDTSSPMIVLVALAIAVVLGGWIVFSQAEFGIATPPAGAISTPATAPPVPRG
jgi:hypothetical protein